MCEAQDSSWYLWFKRHDYIYKVLPLKMQYNLHYIKLFTVLYDIKIIFRTVGAVLGLEENNSQQSDS